MISLSYIIPTYNNLNLLKRCLESIIIQLDKDDQIIIVDDGSKDGTYSYLVGKYSGNAQITILTQENLGSGYARNEGILHSDTDYIWFVDSDDYITNNAAKLIKGNISVNQNDILYFDYYLVKESSITSSKEVISSNKLELLLTNHFPWNKVIKRSLFENVKFPINKIRFQDHATIPKLIDKAVSIGYLKEKLYYYDMSHEGNISKNKNKLKDIYTACDILNDYFKENTLYKEYILVKTFLFDRLFIISALNLKEKFIELHKIKKYLNENAIDWRHSELISFKNKNKFDKYFKNYKVKLVIANIFKHSTIFAFLVLSPLLGYREYRNKNKVKHN